MTLFHHNPPSQRNLQHELFVNRNREMKKLAEKIPGDFNSSSILVIHGSSRVGKSHLALNFLATLDDAYHLFIVKAAGGRTARQILIDLFQLVRQSVLEITSPAILEPEGVSAHNILEEGRELIGIFDGLICGTEQSREITYSDAFEKSNTFRFLMNAFGITPELSGSIKATQTTTKKITISAPDDYRLVDILCELCDVLMWSTQKKSLIYIDDVDLLDDGPFIDQEMVVKLIRLLHRLAESNNVTIVTSMRTRHLTIAQKELSEALNVRRLSDEDMQEVYKRHIARFRPGRPVFDEICLATLTEFASGRIGNFLRLCAKVLDWGDLQGRTEGRTIDLSDLEDFIRDEIRELSLNLDFLPYLTKIREAAGIGKLEVDLDTGVMGTSLVYLLLEEPLRHSQTQQRYGIIPLAARVIQGMELGRQIQRS